MKNFSVFFNKYLLVILAITILNILPAKNSQNKYPSKPITILVAYPAGGDTDAVARLFAEKLSLRLNQTVIVENKAGASGILGTKTVANSKPDGYTLLLAPSTFSIAQFVVNPGSGGYDVLNDFSPISLLGTQPLVIATNVSKIKDFDDLINQAKSLQINYSSPGNGSPMHIFGEMFNKATNLNVLHVPYKGVAPAINDLIGGHIPLSFVTLGPIEQLVKEGKIKMLAVAQQERTKLAPNVPTLEELGIKNVEISAWQGLFAPKKTPAEIIALLNRHMNEILKLPEVIERLNVLGIEVTGGTPKNLADINSRDFKKLGNLIKELGIND